MWGRERERTGTVLEDGYVKWSSLKVTILPRILFWRTTEKPYNLGQGREYTARYDPRRNQKRSSLGQPLRFPWHIIVHFSLLVTIFTAQDESEFKNYNYRRYEESYNRFPIRLPTHGAFRRESVVPYVTIQVAVLDKGNSRWKTAVDDTKIKVPCGGRTPQNTDIGRSTKQLTMTSVSKTVLLLALLNSVLLRTEQSVVFPGDSTSKPSPTFTQLSTEEIKCLETGKMFYEPDGKCYSLLQSGPCSENQWLVLDKDEVVSENGGLHAVCRQCPCCGKRFRAVYWPADGKCYRLFRDSRQLCPSPGTVLQVDPFGEGECACEKEPLHERWDVKNMDTDISPCYPLYQRGPCDNGHIFVPHYNSTRCEKDPCSQQNKDNSAVRYVEWKYGNNRCYKLGSKGPCHSEGTATFNIHPVTRRPACINRANQIVDLPPICDTDLTGVCRQEFELPSPIEYLNALYKYAERRRNKRKARRSKY